MNCNAISKQVNCHEITFIFHYFIKLRPLRRFYLESNATTRKMIKLAEQMKLKIGNTIFVFVQRYNRYAHQFVEHFHKHRMKPCSLFHAKFLLSMYEAATKKKTEIENNLV